MPSLISYASRGGVETDYEPETLHFILAAFLLASVASLSPREKDPRLAHMPWRVDCGWIVPGGRWSILGNLDREELSAFRRLGVAAWLALGMESALESIVTATTGKQCDDESEENGMSGITHSKDFSSLTCNGKTYYFASPLRQDIIRLLFQEWATTRIDGAGVLTEDVIGKRLRGSTGTVRVAKALGKVDDVRDIVKRVKPATWGLWLNFPQERDPGW
jgi:hypothetical protein